MENPNDDITTPPITPMPKRNRRKLTVLILVILALVIGGISAYLLLKPKTPTQNPNPQSTTPPKKSTKRVVYAVKAGDVVDGNRQFLKYEIWYADAGSTPKSLGVYGEAGKYFYPDGTQLSRDGKTVFLLYDNSLESIDIASKKVTTHYNTSADRRITSFIQNQSGKELLVSTTIYPPAPGKATVVLDRVNPTDNNKVTNEYSAQRSDIYLRAWRSDDVIVFNDIMYSEFTRYGTYNLKTKAITNTADNKHSVHRLVASRDGDVIGIPSGSVEDICNKFSGSSTNKFTLLNPLTEKSIADIAVTDIIANVEIGKNGKAIITTLPFINDDSKCESTEAQVHSYAVYDTATKKMGSKTTYQDAYKKVFPDLPFIEAKLENKICTLTVESQQTLTKECAGGPEYLVIDAVTISQ